MGSALQPLRSSIPGAVEAWVAQRDAVQSGDLRGRSLVGADLSGLDLSGRDLSNADLTDANLRSANLTQAVLRGACLQGAQLDEAELLGADLEGAQLDQVSARQAGFGRSNCRGASFFGADLFHSTFTEANLQRCDFRTARLEAARMIKAELQEADFGRAYLREANLEGASVGEASFLDADLRFARLRGVSGYKTANFIRTDVRDVDFSAAYQLRRQIRDENYLHEFRTRNRLHGCLYWVWWLTSDCGRSLGRWALSTLLLTLVFGGVYQLVDIDYGEHPTPLSPFYFSVVTITTLGYGDVTPASTAGQIVAMVQVCLGYMMLGGLISIFANKMARRAD
ncbi:MAG: pentapeptide repeat-containing protein [Myxococcota bacterium]